MPDPRYDDLREFTIFQWYLPYLLYGEDDGMEPGEAELVDEFQERYGLGDPVEWDEESRFDVDEISGVWGEVIDVSFLPREAGDYPSPPYHPTSREEWERRQREAADFHTELKRDLEASAGDMQEYQKQLDLDLIEWFELPSDSHGYDWEELRDAEHRLKDALQDSRNSWPRFQAIYPEHESFLQYQLAIDRLMHWYKSGYYLN